MPLIDCWPPVVIDDGRLNVDVDGDVGGERRRWGLKLSDVFGESGLFGDICNGWERILKCQIINKKKQKQSIYISIHL